MCSGSTVNPSVLPVECSSPTFFYPSIFPVEIVCSAPTVTIPVFCSWSVPIPQFSFPVFSQWKNCCVFQSHIFLSQYFPSGGCAFCSHCHLITVYISQWRLCVSVPHFSIPVFPSGGCVFRSHCHYHMYISQWRLCVPVPNPNVMRLLLICIHC